MKSKKEIEKRIRSLEIKLRIPHQIKEKTLIIKTLEWVLEIGKD